MSRKAGKAGLTALYVHKTTRAGRHHDGGGHGLYLCVSDTGAKRWEQRITVGGRRRTLGLGRYCDVPLKAARQKAMRNWLLADEGVDPLAQKIANRPVPTFAEAAEEVIKDRRDSWTAPKMEKRWRRALEIHVYPRLKNFRVTDIETQHVVGLLQAVRTRAPKSLPRIRQYVGAVTSWAVGQGYRRDDPCGPALDAVMRGAAPRTRSHSALPYRDVPAAVAIVRGANEWIGTRFLFEFLVLTAVRTNEARGALWSEVDFDAARWTVPAGRMKERAKHCVPLSTAALALLREVRGHPTLRTARRSGGQPDLVFPSMGGRVLYNNAVSKLLKELNIDAVPHGFRASFRTWAAETRVDFDVAETCLAHAVGTHVSRLYGRTDLFDARVPVMEQWGRYVETDAVLIRSLTDE